MKPAGSIRGSTLKLRALLLVLVLGFALPLGAKPLTLWHSYRGTEKDTLENLIREWNQAHVDTTVTPLAIPNDAFPNKLRAAIPQGHGPDLFLFAHNEVGNFASLNLLQRIDDEVSQGELGEFFANSVDAMRYDGALYGLPLATKSVALFYNRALVKTPPETTDELLRIAREHTKADEHRYGLAYEAGNVYFHAAWLFGFGARVLSPAGVLNFDVPGVAESFAFVADLMLREKVIPEEANGALVSDLFNRGLVPMVINGPWFVGEIKPDIDFGVAPLPVINATSKPATPFLTVEGALFPRNGPHFKDALRFARHLCSYEIATRRALEGSQVVATKRSFQNDQVRLDPVLMGFFKQLPRTVVMDNRPVMSMLWEPMKLALAKLLRGDVTPDEAVEAAVARYAVLSRPAPKAGNPTYGFIALAAFLLVLSFMGFRRGRKSRLATRMFKARQAYVYLFPAFLGLILVLFIPFIVGSLLALFHHKGGEFTYVGFENFKSILFAKDYPITSAFSVYFTLAVTMLWTVSNVFLHVAIGLSLAMVLRKPWLKLRGIYRVLLIIPWAVPNYITALIWKGMFNKQFGAINALLSSFGVEPIGWFSQFWTAFTANLVTNTWLGFPFMMVVTLGALQAVPKDLEEAAEIDGATAWQRFTKVILPQIKPALLPAIILGTIWTFNMFNIIYLVSQGEPDGSTEILITEAYKWAFERQYQYGYAAAYATVIFAVLLFYDAITKRLILGRGGKG